MPRTPPIAAQEMAAPEAATGESGAWDDPESSLQGRGRLGFGAYASWAERRALSRCLQTTGPLTRICDCPSGAGRLVPFWNRLGVTILCVDPSAEMVAAAAKRIAHARAPGRAIEARAENLFAVALPQPDLVASVRFGGLSDRSSRLRLLRAFAAATRRFVLVEYRTTETRKGRRSAARELRAQAYCSREEIECELAAADLRMRAFEPISRFSDRAFVLGERTDRPPLR